MKSRSMVGVPGESIIRTKTRGNSRLWQDKLMRDLVILFLDVMAEG
jgi:hypothetical protein